MKAVNQTCDGRREVRQRYGRRKTMRHLRNSCPVNLHVYGGAYLNTSLDAVGTVARGRVVVRQGW